MAVNNKDFVVKNGLQVGSNTSITGSLTAAGLSYPVSDGTFMQAVVTDGSGNLSFENIDTVESDVTNNTGSLIAKGTPVYQTGAAGQTLTIAPSDAAIASTMPSIGVAASDIADGDTGRIIHSGFIKGVDTSAFNEGDRIYVADGGGYQVDRPAGEDHVVQFLGVVTKVHATNGSGVVFNTASAYSVPNLDDGNIFIGDSNNLPVTATLDTDIVPEGSSNEYFTNARAISAIEGSSNLTIDGGTLYIDTSNNYIGINDTSPSQALDVTGAIAIGGTTVIDSGGEVVTAQLKNSGVTQGTYGSSSAIPVLTIDTKGRVTSASTTAVAGVDGVSYNSSTGQLTVETATGTDYTVDIGVGTGDSPTFVDLTVDSIQLTGGAGDQGTLSWNSSDRTLDLNQNDTTLQLGQETHFMIRNATGSTIANGAFLGFSGVTVGSNRIEASPFDASTMEEHQLVGFATETISNGVNGLVTTFGYVRGLDTRGTAPSGMAVGDEDWSVGDILYPHPTVPGKLTTVEPTTGFKAKVAVITNRHQSAGEIFVRVTPHNERFDEYASTAYGWGDHDGLYVTPTYTGNVNINGNLTVDTNTLFVDSTNNRVGIGTSSPDFLTTISSTTNAITGTSVNVSGLQMKIQNPNNANNEAVGLGFGLSENHTNIGAAIIHTRENAESVGSMHFATKSDNAGGADIPIRMTISKDGKVGIGTDSPIAKLEISDSSTNHLVLHNTTYQSSNWDTEASLLFKVNASSDNERSKGGILFKNDNSDYGRGDLHFLVDSNNDNGNAVLSDSKMVITHEGNVGIGMSTPGQKLEVAGVIKSKRADYAKIMLNSTTPNNTWVVENSSGKLAFTEENVAAHMHIAQGGNVGIGTDNPSSKLHVVGDIYSTTQIRANSGSASTPNFAIDGGTGIFRTASNNIGFSTASNERMNISSSGLLPAADATYDLGSASLRWDNVYTTDMHFSNMGKEGGNDVDGTTGDWTLQEGEDSIYMINNITGKKYAIMLKEID
jgi:hypothetical protein